MAVKSAETKAVATVDRMGIHLVEKTAVQSVVTRVEKMDVKMAAQMVDSLVGCWVEELVKLKVVLMVALKAYDWADLLVAHSAV